MNMRLIGARNVSEVVPSMVDTSSLSLHVTAVPEDRLYRGNCKLCLLLPILRQSVDLADLGSIACKDEAMRGAEVREVIKAKL